MTRLWPAVQVGFPLRGQRRLVKLRHMSDCLKLREARGRFFGVSLVLIEIASRKNMIHECVSTTHKCVSC